MLHHTIYQVCSHSTIRYKSTWELYHHLIQNTMAHYQHLSFFKKIITRNQNTHGTWLLWTIDKSLKGNPIFEASQKFGYKLKNYANPNSITSPFIQLQVTMARKDMSYVFAKEHTNPACVTLLLPTNTTLPSSRIVASASTALHTTRYLSVLQSSHVKRAIKCTILVCATPLPRNQVSWHNG